MGSLRTVFACGSLVARSFGVGSLEFDLDAHTLVYEDGCAWDMLRLWVATADGQRRVIYEGAKQELAGLAIRGEYVGALIYPADKGPTHARLNVLDQTGRRLFQVAPEPGTRFLELALGADGEVAVTSAFADPRQIPCNRRLGRTSIAQPTLRPIATAGCPGNIKLTRRTIHYTDSSGVHAVGADGTDRLVVGRGGVEFAGYTSVYDVDGALVTYGLRNCDGSAAIRTIRASETARPESSRCPARFVNRKRLRLVKRGIRVRLRCPRGCAGPLTVLRGRRDVRYYGDVVFVQSRRSRTYHLRLNDRTVRLLRRRGSLRLLVSARVEQRSQGRFRTVRQRVTVVR